VAIDDIARERVEALSLRLTENSAAAKEANRIALDAAEKAVLKAESAADKRFEGLNELRGMVSDQQARFATIEIVDANFKAVEARLSMLERQSAADGGRDGLSMPLMLMVVGLVSSVLSGVLVYFISHLK